MHKSNINISINIFNILLNVHSYYDSNIINIINIIDIKIA